VSAFTVDPFDGTCLLLYFINEVVVWFGFAGSMKPRIGIPYVHPFLQNVNGHIPEGISQFKIQVVVHNLCDLIYANKKMVLELL